MVVYWSVEALKSLGSMSITLKVDNEGDNGSIPWILAMVMFPPVIVVVAVVV